MAQRVHNANIPPKSAVCYLAMHWSNPVAWAHGSGALIDSRHILTCSHNLVDPVTNHQPRGRATNAFAYRAYNQRRPADPPPGGLQVKVGFYSTRFQAGQDAWDVGVMRLENDIVPPVPFGYFVPTLTGAEIEGEYVELTGYPGPGMGEMYEDRDTVDLVHIDTNTMIYTHDTWGGNSGSPTWTYDSVSDTIKQRGIHVSMHAQELRRGVLITAPILRWIQGVIRLPDPPGQGFRLHGVGDLEATEERQLEEAGQY